MLLRQTLFYLPAQLLGPLFQFVAAVVWTHQLETVSYGVVTYLIAAQELAFVFALGWWSAYVLRFKAELTQRYGDSLRQRDLAFVLAGSAFQVLAAFPVLWSISVPVTPSLYALTAFFLITRSALSHYAEICRAEKAFATYTVTQLSSPVLGSLLSFAALAYIGPDPGSVLGALGFAQGLGLLIVLRRLRVGGIPVLPDGEIFHRALRYCGPLMASSIPYWISANGIRLTVDSIAGPVALGLLSVGWGLGQRIAAVAGTLVTTAAFPLAVERLETGGRDDALRQVSINGMLILGALAPVVVGAFVVVRPLVDLMIAAPFRDATVIIFPIATLAGAVRNFSNHGFNQAFMLLTRTELTFVFQSLDATLTVLFCCIGVYYWGITGAALGCLASGVCAALFSLIYAAQLGLPVAGSTMARIALAAAIMGGTLVIIPWPGGVIGLAATIVTGGIVYAIALVASFPELRSLVRLRRRA